MPGGITCLNKLQTIDYGSFTNEDEMSLEYLYKVPMYQQSFVWDSEDVQGALLYSQYINPTQFDVIQSNTTLTQTIQYVNTVPFSYIARMFGQWRGSFKLTLKFIKTQMHSGRIQVTFLPSTKLIGTPATITASAYALRSIIDIRTEDTVTLELPYLSYSDYLYVTEEEDVSVGTISGLLEVRVLNNLKSPATVSQNIDVQVFYTAGDDFELCVPTSYAGGMPYTPQMSGEELVIDSIDQGMTMVDGTVGGISVTGDSLFHSARCIGERIFSIKSLLNRNSCLSNYFAGFNIVAQNQFLIRPWFTATCKSTPGTSLNGCYLGGDAYTQLVPMYAFMRGGVKINVMSSLSTQRIISGSLPFKSVVDFTQPILASSFSNFISETNTNTPGINVGLYPLEPVNTLDTPALAFQHTPYYAPLPMSLVVSSNGVVNVENDPSQPWAVANFRGSANFTGTTTIQRSVADDFQAMFFIGCPPQIVKTITL